MSPLDWIALENATRANLLANRKLERDLAERGIDVPPKPIIIAMAEQLLIGNVQIINAKRGGR